MQRKNSLTILILLAILGSWAYVLRQFDFPILPIAPFLKVDFSDIAVLCGLLVKGPVGMIAVAGIRDLINYITKGGEAGYPIGAVMSLIASVAFLLPTHLSLKHHRLATVFGHAVNGVTSILVMTLVMGLLNYFVALPLYITILNFPVEDIGAYVVSIIVPFNLIKGIILAVAQVFMIRILSPLLLKRKYLFNHYGFSSS